MKVAISALTILLFVLLSLTQCKKDCVNADRCNLDPDAGPCKALIVKYYYDKKEKKCKTFNWGGCDGVVPFETLEDCQNKCGCNN